MCLEQNPAQRRADEIRARRLAERDEADEPTFDTRPAPLVAVGCQPCRHQLDDWVCVALPHPQDPDRHYYVKRAS